MIKSVPSSVWAFDCEWVPDVKSGRMIYDLSDSLSDDEVIEHMWKEGGATEEDPRPFLKLILSRVVSVAVLSRTAGSSGDVQLELHSLPLSNEPLDERGLIERFLSGVGKKKPQLVGFNSFDSDLPILLQRGLATGVTAPQFSKRPNKPWEGLDYFSRSSEAHIDIRAILGVWGKGNPSLHQLAVACGIPGKIGVDGQEVFELWKAGKIREIVNYNEWDAITTYLVWLRMAFFSGLFSEVEYRQEEGRLETFLNDLVEAKAKTHLKIYLDHWAYLKKRI
ncbi:MAG TPA: 3'-5' exonuclease [Oligoflexia bacterium]|nr:3'-5' exonuclease [Oligoflexia bacterium]HMP47761.1 3'-5' exonuclease [Oligoflexia bacterium]